MGFKMAKISTFIIGSILFTLFIAVLLVITNSMNKSYAGSSYSQAELSGYNHLEELANLTNEINNASELKQNSGLLDIAGFYISGAYNTLKVSKASISTFDDMANSAVSQSKLGDTAVYFRLAVGSITLVIVVLGIIVSALLYNKI